ncbi:hypothetical protein [Oceanobacillus sp. FSL K6-0127]
MKKLISGVALTVVLATGFFFAQGVQQGNVEIAGEHEPSILNVSSSSVFF